MTFVEIESRRRLCWFLSNNVKKWCGCGMLLSLPFPWWCRRRSGEGKGIRIYIYIKSLHLFKHTIVHRRWARGDIIMTIICSYQKSRTSWDRGGRSKQERKSQSVIFLGSGLITDLSDIKAGCCDRSALTYGSSAHTPHEGYICRPPHREWL